MKDMTIANVRSDSNLSRMQDIEESDSSEQKSSITADLVQTNLPNAEQVDNDTTANKKKRKKKGF
jgi:hypothetical protein